MKQSPEMIALSKVVDVLGLCWHLGEVLDYNPANCDHTFKHTRAYLAEYSPDAEAEDVLSTLRRMGANCDCEVGFNICPEVGA